jgi:hypothetical protein
MNAKDDWMTAQASSILKRLDKRIAKNKVYVVEPERNGDELKRKADDIHEQLEDFGSAVRNLRAYFVYLRARIAVERSTRMAVEDRINEIVIFFV